MRPRWTSVSLPDPASGLAPRLLYSRTSRAWVCWPGPRPCTQLDPGPRQCLAPPCRDLPQSWAQGAWPRGPNRAGRLLSPASRDEGRPGRTRRPHQQPPPGALSTGRLCLPTPGWAVGLPSLGAGGQLLLSAKSPGARSHIPRIRPPSPLQEKLHFTSLSLRGPQQGDGRPTPAPPPGRPASTAEGRTPAPP